jgi:hypothetical protein
MGANLVINGVYIVPIGAADAFLMEGDDGLSPSIGTVSAASADGR